MILPGFRKFRLLVVFLLPAIHAAMAGPIRLAQEPALSPDGNTLAFAWRGDIWSVSVKGGVARRLTQHPAIDSSPAFSPDGKQIAFVSDREGSKQIFVMPTGDGEPRQLTWHTEGYKLEGWFPDGKGLLVSITRDHFWKHGERLARVDATARKAEQVLLDDYAADGSVSPDGKRVLFTREGEVWWRQGYEGSRAGQIWMLNREDGSCRQLQSERTECRWPQWEPDGAGYYYVSGRSGVWNLWEHDAAGGKEKQLTAFKTDAVVFPTVSRDGKMIVFRHQFDFYRLRTGGDFKPEKIEIQQTGDALSPAIDRLVLEKATDAAFTANGLQIAFIAGGDVWVMDTELREPRQVTRTAEEERDVVFAPDGKSLWFVSDAGGQTDIWKAQPKDPGKFWWENREFKLTRITNDAAQAPRLDQGTRRHLGRGRGRRQREARRGIMEHAGL
jgi:tricorn protease